MGGRRSYRLQLKRALAVLVVITPTLCQVDARLRSREPDGFEVSDIAMPNPIDLLKAAAAEESVKGIDFDDLGVDIESGTVTMEQRSTTNSVVQPDDIPYYRCGPAYKPPTSLAEEESGEVIHEVLLFHGEKFTKEDWKTSGIMQKLCAQNELDTPVKLSVLALDISSESDGMQVAALFAALTDAEIISGWPVVAVTPSDSGYGIMNLAEISSGNVELELDFDKDEAQDFRSNLLRRMVGAWVSIGALSVLQAEVSSIKEFEKNNIPVLSVNGSEDAMGLWSLQVLEKQTSAKSEIVGRHRWSYLDEPDKFATIVGDFSRSMGNDD